MHNYTIIIVIIVAFTAVGLVMGDVSHTAARLLFSVVMILFHSCHVVTLFTSLHSEAHVAACVLSGSCDFRPFSSGNRPSLYSEPGFLFAVTFPVCVATTIPVLIAVTCGECRCVCVCVSVCLSAPPLYALYAVPVRWE